MNLPKYDALEVCAYSPQIHVDAVLNSISRDRKTIRSLSGVREPVTVNAISNQS